MCDQSQKGRMHVEVPPVKALPEAVRNKPTRQSAPLKAVPEHVRNLAPPAPGGPPPQARETWPGPPSAPPPELDDKGSQRWQIGVDVNHPWRWSARDRTLINTLESYLKKSAQIQVGISELEDFLLSPGDDAISIMSCAKNACDGGCKKLAVLETKRGVEVAFLRVFAREPRQKLQEAIK